MCLTGILCATLGVNCIGFLTQNINMLFVMLNQITKSLFGVVSGTGVISGSGYPGFS